MDPTQNPDRQYDPQPPVPQHQQTPQPQTIRYIAVDENGKPLENQPAQFQQPGSPGPQMVYMSRPMDPQSPQISDEARQKHEDSKVKYPSLNLSEGEYIINAIKRHPIGLISVWFVVGLVLAVLMAILGIFAAYRDSAQLTAGVTQLPPTYVLGFLVAILGALTLLGGTIATIVYNGNRFFLTNESVIQEIQTSLFSRREQTVSLGNIEDASYSQDGIIQSVIGYGLIRLSTEGDETTYRFNYVSHPKKQIAMLNNAVEAFKNGRPVTGV